MPNSERGVFFFKIEDTEEHDIFVYVTTEFFTVDEILKTSSLLQNKLKNMLKNMLLLICFRYCIRW